MASCSAAMARASWTILLALSLAASLLVSAALADPPQTVTASDQLQFEQKTAQTQMQELQERMYSLADLTRQTEPDDSARLLLAVRKARENLIIEQMRDVLDQLSTADLAKASDEQTQVLAKLEELKKLLTSTDLDLQLQLERLRALSAAIAKLDGAIKEEKRQQGQSGALAQAQKAAPLDPKALDQPRQDQQQNRSATDAIAQTVKDLGPAPAQAAQVLGGASKSMSQAEASLGSGSPGDAQDLQGQAADAMQKARDQLEQERQKVLEELQGQVRKQVVANLTEMLDRQKSVRGATEGLLAASPTSDRATAVKFGQLSDAETAINRICDQTIDLINETQFSIALPAALKDIGQSCQEVADELQTAKATPTVVGDEKQIERDLADLLDTFKELQADPGEGGKGGGKDNKNKLLAELKVLRLLQTRVNDRTVKVDAERAGTQDAPSSQLQAKIKDVRDSQSEVQVATDKIHKELSGTN
ncbi:MAG: hypothetical protein ABSH22_00490 [Tepidisphaeraceae bacterium]